MSAYVIADIDVTDAVRYENYKRLSSAAIKAGGAEVCVRGCAVEVLEGSWSPSRVVVLRFSDMAAARAFYASTEYMAARQAREGAATMRMVLVQGAD